ncbi:hypothetical protein LFM09_10375 [Lentzea alba]|uniref:hypothetical protein n=1 Tax=Lentzea alba TaxID=2714351 RepID=UPI0039BEE5F8
MFAMVGGATRRWVVGGPEAIGAGDPVHPAATIAAITRMVDLGLILSPGTAVVRVEPGSGGEVRPDGGRGQYDTDEFRSTIPLSNRIEQAGSRGVAVFDSLADRDEHVT